MSAREDAERIADFLVSVPAGHTTAPTKVVRELLLMCDGQLIVAGILRDISVKPLGAGVYRVSLQEVKP